MPTDFTDLLERTPAPDMQVDPYAVMAGGRRRRLRTRLTTAGAGVAVAAAVTAGAVALPWPLTGTSSTPTPGKTPTTEWGGDCLSPHPGTAEPVPEGLSFPVVGKLWLDSGRVELPGMGYVRTQTYTDTCMGSAVVLSGRAFSEANADSGLTTSDNATPDGGAFWTLNVFGQSERAKGSAVAAVSLPPGQTLCGFDFGPETGWPQDTEPSLASPVTTSAGHGWTATFQHLPTMENPQGATARVCSGDKIIHRALRPVNAITTLEPAPTGTAITYAETQPDGSTIFRDATATSPASTRPHPDARRPG